MKGNLANVTNWSFVGAHYSGNNGGGATDAADAADATDAYRFISAGALIPLNKVNNGLNGSINRK